MILKRTYDLDILPGAEPMIIRASQYDSSSRLVFYLYVGDGVLDVPSGCTVAFRGTFGSLTGSLDFVDDAPVVTVDLTRVATTDIGRAPFEIMLTTGTYKLISATHFLDVKGAA